MNLLGYHTQTGNGDGFLLLDFGVAEFVEVDAEERLRLYRAFVYTQGAADYPDKPKAKKIRKNVFRKARKKNFKPNRMERFLVRSRYFTDSGVTGSKAFVVDSYLTFQDLFRNPGRHRPKPVHGLPGGYSFKQLINVV